VLSSSPIGGSSIIKLMPRCIEHQYIGGTFPVAPIILVHLLYWVQKMELAVYVRLSNVCSTGYNENVVFFYMLPAHIHWCKMVVGSWHQCTGAVYRFSPGRSQDLQREDLQFSHLADFLGVSIEANRTSRYLTCVNVVYCQKGLQA
jgi:hypothetical protein